jgi:hypothetical protein
VGGESGRRGYEGLVGRQVDGVVRALEDADCEEKFCYVENVEGMVTTGSSRVMLQPRGGLIGHGYAGRLCLFGFTAGISCMKSLNSVGTFTTPSAFNLPIHDSLELLT